MRFFISDGQINIGFKLYCLELDQCLESFPIDRIAILIN